MKITEGRKLRHLKDVSYDELQKAVVEMCEKLAISGSYAGSFDAHYSLYEAVRNEKKKVSPKDPLTKLIE